MPSPTVNFAVTITSTSIAYMLVAAMLLWVFIRPAPGMNLTGMDRFVDMFKHRGIYFAVFLLLTALVAVFIWAAYSRYIVKKTYPEDGGFTPM